MAVDPKNIERHSLTWRTVEEWARGKLEETRNALEQQQTPEQTEWLRGECHALRALLRLPEADGRPILPEPGMIDGIPAGI